MKNKDLEIKDLGFGIIYTTETKQDVKWKDKWQKLKEFIKTYQEDVVWKNKQVDEFQEELLDKMQELSKEE